MDIQEEEPQVVTHKKKQKSGFAQYNFTVELYKAILLRGLHAPLPIQKKALPVIMEGRDAIVNSKTGSGKTLAYILPMINKLKCHSQIVGARGLILIPTRDLALQVANVLKEFLKFTDLRYTLLLGGHSYEGQFESIASNPDILIATPGRLMQLLVQTELKLTRIEMLIFDEADNLFEKGFQMQMSEIIKRCPVSQKLMFSATIPEQLNTFAGSGLRDYVFIKHEVTLPEKMTLDFLVVRQEEKLPTLLYLLQNLSNQKVIVFASTRYHVDLLATVISKQFNCVSVYGKMDMEQRGETLNIFRNSKQCVLVVTDLASRGLDIPEVNYVIHYDYPTNHKIFVHRSGRTARSGAEGHTLALINHNQISYMIELCFYVSRKLLSDQDAEAKEVAYYGILSHGLVSEYERYLGELLKDDPEIRKMEETASKAMVKFKKCRTPASSFSIKQSKDLPLPVHSKFRNEDDQQQQFLNRIRNYNPQKSFLELQKVRQDKDETNDSFLAAVSKIRKEQEYKLSTKETRKNQAEDRNREMVEMLEQDHLRKEQLQQLQEYRQNQSKKRTPILPNIAGVSIEILNNRVKKSQVRDFKNKNQYIEATKPIGYKTEFDELQKIKSSEVDNTVDDEGKMSRRNRQTKRVWDKKTKQFKYMRDAEDKLSKEEKGKKAYLKWKKTTHLSMQKVGEAEDKDTTNLAKDYWLKRRKFAKGWKEDKNKHQDVQRGKKGEVIRKKIKKRMVGAGRSGKKGGSKGSKKGRKSGR